MIGIKNTSKDTIAGRYDGRDYEFRPDVTEVVTIEAARHIFGFGLEDKTRAFLRLGWLRDSGSKAAAEARLAEIQFLAVETKVKEADTPKLPMSAGADKETLHLPKKDSPSQATIATK